MANYLLLAENKLGDQYQQKQYHILTKKFDQLETYYDTTINALWCILKPDPAPVFTETLLQNIRNAQDMIADVYHNRESFAPNYIIWLSNHPRVFNLGLDMQLISECIETNDKVRLNKYIELCIDVFYINLVKLDIKPTITISLIRGKAYGGGLEAALSSDIVIAEEGSKCCFPEIRYNLLPSLGTLHMLMRRMHSSILDSCLFKGKQIDLESLKEMGLIERIVPARKGEQAILEIIKEIQKKHRVYSYLYGERSKSVITSHSELENFKNLWLDTALNLSRKDLVKLRKLAYAQSNYK